MNSFIFLIKKLRFFLIIMAVFWGLLFGVFALASNIDSTYKYSWGENIGWMNWAPVYNSTAYGVTVYDECLTGYIWAENGGWIKTGNTTCSGGDCCQAGTSYGYENDSNSTDDDGDGVADDWGVNVDGDGNLSGYAWGENVGWINFDDTSSNDYNQVTIDTDGNFSNYAWGENIGWINMNCSNTDYCSTVDFKVKTNWSPISAPTVSSDEGSDIQVGQAQLNGELTSMGGDSSVTVWFQWGETNSYGNTTASQTKSATSTFAATITGLSPGATYYFRAVAQNSQGTSYGTGKSFDSIGAGFFTLSPSVQAEETVHAAEETEEETIPAAEEETLPEEETSVPAGPSVPTGPEVPVTPVSPPPPSTPTATPPLFDVLIEPTSGQAQKWLQMPDISEPNTFSYLVGGTLFIITTLIYFISKTKTIRKM